MPSRELANMLASAMKAKKQDTASRGVPQRLTCSADKAAKASFNDAKLMEVLTSEDLMCGEHFRAENGAELMTPAGEGMLSRTMVENGIDEDTVSDPDNVFLGITDKLLDEIAGYASSSVSDNSD